MELSGFRTAIRENVQLQVDVQSKLDVPLAIGSLSETVKVTSDVVALNTTDASMGNVITGQQVRALPLEANNVIGLLSLQPGRRVPAERARSGLRGPVPCSTSTRAAAPSAAAAPTSRTSPSTASTSTTRSSAPRTRPRCA